MRTITSQHTKKRQDEKISGTNGDKDEAVFMESTGQHGNAVGLDVNQQPNL
jgi:hypothetical protein